MGERVSGQTTRSLGDFAGSGSLVGWLERIGRIEETLKRFCEQYSQEMGDDSPLTLRQKILDMRANQCILREVSAQGARSRKAYEAKWEAVRQELFPPEAVSKNAEMELRQANAALSERLGATESVLSNVLRLVQTMSPPPNRAPGIGTHHRPLITEAIKEEDDVATDSVPIFSAPVSPGESTE